MLTTTVSWEVLAHNFCFYFHVIMEPSYCQKECLSQSIPVQQWTGESPVWKVCFKENEKCHSILWCMIWKYFMKCFTEDNQCRYFSNHGLSIWSCKFLYTVYLLTNWYYFGQHSVNKSCITSLSVVKYNCFIIRPSKICLCVSVYAIYYIIRVRFPAGADQLWGPHGFLHSS